MYAINRSRSSHRKGLHPEQKAKHYRSRTNRSRREKGEEAEEEGEEEEVSVAILVMAAILKQRLIVLLSPRTHQRLP